MKLPAQRWRAGLTTAAALLAGVASLVAQQPGTAVRGGFTHTEPHDPPNQNQPKFILKGSEARSLSGGRYLVTSADLESFKENGRREMKVEAPEGVFDSSTRTVSSDGRIRVIVGDGEFTIEGAGFLWDGKTSLLTISNDVRALVQRGVTNATEAQPPPLEITAARFEFDQENRRAIFRDNVRGSDPEVEFSCGVLTARASAQSETFDVIEAEQGVEILSKAEERRVRAQRAVYTRADERVEFTGGVEWQQARHEGKSARLVFHRLDRSIEATGDVAMKLPRESLGLGGFFLADTNTPATEVESPLVDLFADKFRSQSNLTVVTGSVRIVDATNRLSCDKLTIRSVAPGSPEETAHAEGNVVVEQGDDQIRAARADYRKAEDTIVFTGQPRWTLDDSEGSAEVLRMRPEAREFHGEGDVRVKVPLGAGSASFLTLFPAGAETNNAPDVIEIRAKEFKGREKQVTFLGNVRAHEAPITGSEPRLRSDSLEVQFAADGRRVDQLVARNNVIYEQGAPGATNGPTMHRKLIARTVTAHASPETGALSELVAEGDVRIEQHDGIARGERAIYDAARDLLELTGEPTLETVQGTSRIIVHQARSVIVDRASGRFSALPPYKFSVKRGAGESGGEF